MISVVKQMHVAVLLLLAVLLNSVAVMAHPLSVSYSSFILDENEVRAVYRLPMDDMDLLFRLDKDIDGVVTDAELQAAHGPIQDYLNEWANLSANGNKLDASLQKLGTWQDNSDFPHVEASVTYASENSINTLDASVTVLTNLYQDHRNLAEFSLGDQREEHVFHRGTTWSGTRDSVRSWNTAWQFFLLGVEHIITGYDHVLFVLGLLLVAGNLRNLVLIITAFTIAHSITLALSTLGIVQVSSRIIEVLIALSIAYVGLENLVVKNVKNRWLLTFVFGLAHGFGFAGILQNMDLERQGLLLGLLTFNLGVEAGQLFIIALCWPLLQQLAKTGQRQLIVRLVSGVILLFGIYWLVERILWV